MPRKSSEPDLLAQALSPLSKLSAGVFANQITAFLTEVATVGGSAAIAGLSGPASATILAVAALFGITEAWQSVAKKKKAAQLAAEFAKLKGGQKSALRLINDIADGKAGVTLDWFTQEELKDRIVAGLRSAGLATSRQVARLNREIREGREEERIYHDTADLMLREILRMLDRRVEDPPRAEADTFEREYLKAVIASLDEMELFGIDPRIDPAKRKQQLSIAYLALNLTDERGQDQAPTPFAELLAGLEPAKRNKVLIRGDAGSGKTTLLKWAAIEAAKAEFPTSKRSIRSTPRGAKVEAATPDAKEVLGLGEIPAWKPKIPFFVPLRKCSGGKFPSCAVFPALVNESLRKPPDNWVESILEEGRALVMIDGVDEVPPKWRKAIDKGIDNLLKLYGKKGNLFVATSRPLVEDSPWIQAHGFREARIAPMSETDRNDLIDRWHNAVGKQLRELQRGEEAEALPEKAERLKRDLAANPMVAQVAANPLMCAMLCALCGQLDYKLPDSQYEIIEQLCKVLLHSREEHTPDFSLEDFPAAYRRLKYPQRKAILARLAYDMVLGGLSAVPRQALLAKAGVGLAAFTDLADDDDATVADTLIERSGLLRVLSSAEIDFIHNTFKEFLASDRFIAEGHWADLAKKCLQAGFKNVCLFAAAAERAERFVDDLLRKVLPADPPAAQQGRKGRRRAEKTFAPDVHQRRLLAIRIREVAVSPNATLAQRIDRLREDMFPPRTMADAEALAALGDAVVHELKVQSGRGMREKVRCVRALRLISTEQAEQTLQEYADTVGEKETALLGELVQGMNPLKIPEIVRRVTSEPPAGMHPYVEAWLPRSYRQQIHDLAPLAQREDREEVVRLDLLATRVPDAGLQHVAVLTRLQSLNLSGCRQITDAGLKHLSTLTALKFLDLTGCNQITDAGLEHIAALTALKFLDLTGCNQITDAGFEHVAALTALQSLKLSGNQPITDARLAYLAALTDLQSLHLSDMPISDAGLAHLSALTGLQDLNLSGAQITDAGLAHLSALIGLRYLNLSRCQQITDTGLQHLSALTGLRWLRLWGTRITDAGLKHLSTLTALKYLDLDGTQITDRGLEHLAGCTTLKKEWLDTSHTKVTEAGRTRLFQAIERRKRTSR